MPDLSPEMLASLKNIEAWSNLQRKLAKWSLISLLPFLLLVFGAPFFITRHFEKTMANIGEKPGRDWYDVTSAVRKGELEKALSLADGLLQRNPRDFDGLYKRGEILLMVDKRPEALESFKRAAKIFPLPKYTEAVDALERTLPDDSLP